MKNELIDKVNEIISEMRKGDHFVVDVGKTMQMSAVPQFLVDKWANELEDELVKQYGINLNNWLEVQKKIKDDIHQCTIETMSKIISVNSEINALAKKIESLSRVDELMKEKYEKAFSSVELPKEENKCASDKDAMCDYEYMFKVLKEDNLLAKDIATVVNKRIEDLRVEMAEESGATHDWGEHLNWWSEGGKHELPKEGTPEFDEMKKAFLQHHEESEKVLRKISEEISWLEQVIKELGVEPRAEGEVGGQFSDEHPNKESDSTSSVEKEYCKPDCEHNAHRIGLLDGEIVDWDEFKSKPVSWVKDFSYKDGMIPTPYYHATAEILDALYRVNHMASELVRSGAFKSPDYLPNDTIEKIEQLKKYLNNTPHQPPCPRNCDIVKDALEAKHKIVSAGGEKWDLLSVLHWMLEPAIYSILPVKRKEGEPTSAFCSRPAVTDELSAENKPVRSCEHCSVGDCILCKTTAKVICTNWRELPEDVVFAEKRQ